MVKRDVGCPAAEKGGTEQPRHLEFEQKRMLKNSSGKCEGAREDTIENQKISSIQTLGGVTIYALGKLLEDANISCLQTDLSLNETL